MKKQYWWINTKEKSNLEELLFWLNKKVNFSFTISGGGDSQTSYVSKDNKFSLGPNWIEFLTGAYEEHQVESVDKISLVDVDEPLFKTRLDPENTFTFNEITDEEFNKYKKI
jgi:hypothetical protein